MHNEFVTLWTFTYPTEAYPLMTKLQNENIQCFLFDEFTVLTNPFVSNAIGGVKIKVRSQDMQKALKILESINFDNSGKKSPPAKLNEGFAKGFVVEVDEFCPKCNSANIYRKKLSFLSFFRRIEYFCADCGYS